MNPFQFRLVQEYWPVAGAALFVIVMAIVSYDINETHKSILSLANQNFYNSAQEKTEDIELYFDRLKQTAERIAASHSIGSYITRLSSEFSQNQPISKNIKDIEEHFYRFLRKSNSLDNNVYSYIAYINREGALVASVGDALPILNLVEPTEKFEVLTTVDIDRNLIVSSAPVYKNASFEGRVFTISTFHDIQDLLKPRLSNSDTSAHLVFEDGKLFLGPDGMAASISRYLAAHTLTSQKEKTVLHDIYISTDQSDMVGISVPLRNVNASILMLQPKSSLGGRSLSQNHALSLFGFSCFLFMLTFGGNHLRRKNTRLKAKFDNAVNHRKQLTEKNRELSLEVERRKAAEDVSRKKTLELETLNTDLKIAASAFDSIEGMAVIDASRTVLKVNSALRDMLQYDEASLLNRSMSELLEGNLEIEEVNSDLWEVIENGHGWQGEVHFRNKSGLAIERWMAVSPVLSKHGIPTHHILTFYDLSVQKQAEDRVRQLAFYDQLTGLPNRSLLIDRLQNALKANAKKSTYSALMFLDLDNFKSLNDTLGHDVGDELLMAVAKRLQATVGAEQTVARFGGDEFVILMPRLQGETAKEAALDAELFAFCVLDEFEKPFQLNRIRHRCTTSIGIAAFGPEDLVCEDILKHADIAMYQAKKDGRNTVRFYDPELEEKLSQKMMLEHDLHLAFKQRELKLFYQPQVGYNGEVTGAEALLRWYHHELGFVSPAVFVPIAESSGLILKLGNWVLETACYQLASWQDNPAMCDLSLSINISAIQLHRFDFVDQVLSTLEMTGAPATKLKLEITESLLVDNVEDAIEKMVQLRQKGVRFSLDDFGTGYSSLSYLKKLPLDQLKIDQSFVQYLPDEQNDAAIAKMIVALSDTLDISVIAEGVETEEQRDFLRSIGCNEYQGYLYAHPLPLDEYIEFAKLFSGKDKLEAQRSQIAAKL